MLPRPSFSICQRTVRGDKGVSLSAEITVASTSLDVLSPVTVRATNCWMISAFIAGIVFFCLSFVLIGIPLLVILGVLCVVFPIIGGIKASNGEFWSYPMSYRFLPVD